MRKQDTEKFLDQPKLNDGNGKCQMNERMRKTHATAIIAWGRAMFDSACGIFSVCVPVSAVFRANPVRREKKEKRRGERKRQLCTGSSVPVLLIRRGFASNLRRLVCAVLQCVVRAS